MNNENEWPKCNHNFIEQNRTIRTYCINCGKSFTAVMDDLQAENERLRKIDKKPIKAFQIRGECICASSQPGYPCSTCLGGDFEFIQGKCCKTWVTNMTEISKADLKRYQLIEKKAMAVVMYRTVYGSYGQRDAIHALYDALYGREDAMKGGAAPENA